MPGQFQNPLLAMAPNGGFGGAIPPPNALMPPDPNQVTPAQGWAAYAQPAQAAGDWLAQQRAEAVRQGLLDPSTGLPTRAGIRDAAGQFGNALLMGTTEPGAPPVNGLLAYHGSPHSFDRFDMSKMGTGEGNQMYGAGMYLAGNEAVAKSYRDMLSQPKPDGGSSGHMYQVQVNANPEHLLDWDRPLSDQHPVVQDAMAQHLEPYRQQLVSDALPDWREPTPAEVAETHAQADASISSLRGGQAYDRIARQMGYDPVAASQSLQAAGVPGLRYLDQGSRGGDGMGGDPSHNIVAFNDENLQILKKYGIAGLGIGGAAAAQAGVPTSQTAPQQPQSGVVTSQLPPAQTPQ